MFKFIQKLKIGLTICYELFDIIFLDKNYNKDLLRVCISNAKAELDKQTEESNPKLSDFAKLSDFEQAKMVSQQVRNEYMSKIQSA